MNLQTTVALFAPAKPGIPEAEVLGDFGPVIEDKGCREPVGWGWPITRKLTDAEAEALKKFGKIDWTGDGTYALVIRYLQPHEAARFYGVQGAAEYGPRGGFRGVFYGDKQFNHPAMDPKRAVAFNPVTPAVRTPAARTEGTLTICGTRTDVESCMMRALLAVSPTSDTTHVIVQIKGDAT